MRRYLPVFALFVLSPLIAEVLFGATPLSRLGSLLVTAPLYGGGAVLIRELARRAQGASGGGWGRIALLGAAYAIVEEGLALQSMFNPTLFNASLIGGRAWSVNWLWSEWTIGYHIVWSICIPILLAEVLFPARRAEPWLGRGGVSVASVIYLFGAVGLGVITWRFVTPNFRTPLTLLSGAVVVLIALVALALTWPTALSRPVSSVATRHAPSPWVVGAVALLMAAAWFWLLYLPHGLRQGFFVLLPMVLDLLLAAGGVALLRYWSTGRGWRDVHRLALVFGALPITMAWGFFLVTAGNPVDQLGQGGASVVALVLLALLIWQVQRREPVAEAGQAQPNRRAAVQQYPLPNRDRTE